jgi:hypothetical protein
MIVARKPAGDDDKRLEIELQKLVIERTKVKWTAISVIIPLLAAIGTVAFGIWSTHEQETFNFQLEAAKSVMQAPNVTEALGRTKLLNRLFSDRLPQGFLKEIDNPDFAKRSDMTLEPKAHFIITVSNRGLNPLETAQLWHALFKDEWSSRADEEQVRIALASVIRDQVNAGEWKFANIVAKTLAAYASTQNISRSA